MSNQPIGVFDSGVGGTSIWKEIQKLLPNENTIYLADSKNAPYGEKSQEEILQLSIKNTNLLLEKGCKIIVVACNTATTNAISYLRTNYSLPFIGIEPAIKPAALQSESKTIGVLATKGTLSSSLFHSTSENHAHGIKVIEQEGTGLVPLIENGKVDAEETRLLLNTYVEPMLDQGMDCLVLGCTHYPYLIPVLKSMLPEHVKIIDSGEAVARQVKAILEKNDILNTSEKPVKHQFYTNVNPDVLKNFVEGVADNILVGQLAF
ncbi:glutamate racemase [Zobellia laminariae]|uniref:glutamate racemase n=1 Tax=Zobellia laminariae TaxID=248906 RepID=UPI0026F412B5|nr:glutamate racemase [Zobellia laminariae]WKX77311.1 glutamate racemase [Zobellia laminariae]